MKNLIILCMFFYSAICFAGGSGTPPVSGEVTVYGEKIYFEKRGDTYYMYNIDRDAHAFLNSYQSMMFEKDLPYLNVNTAVSKEDILNIIPNQEKEVLTPIEPSYVPESLNQSFDSGKKSNLNSLGDSGTIGTLNTLGTMGGGGF